MSFLALLILLVLLLAVIIPTLYGFSIGAPIFYSPKSSIEDALKFVGAKPEEKFFDLGSGSGRALLIAGKKFRMNVRGYELSPIFWFYSEVNLRLNGIKDGEMRWRNFYKENLSAADVIFCFLTPPAMDKLRPKFEKELKKGTRVISYAFKIPGWTESKIINQGNPGKTYIYIR